MVRIFFRALICAAIVAISNGTQADEGLSVFTTSFEKKLIRLTTFFTTAKEFVGTAGTEQTIIVNIASNGKVMSVKASEPIIDKAFANEAVKLIWMAEPFAAIPVPLANELPIVRLHVAFVLTSQPGLVVRGVEAKGWYKYVDFKTAL